MKKIFIYTNIVFFATVLIISPIIKNDGVELNRYFIFAIAIAYVFITLFSLIVAFITNKISKKNRDYY